MPTAEADFFFFGGGGGGLRVWASGGGGGGGGQMTRTRSEPETSNSVSYNETALPTTASTLLKSVEIGSGECPGVSGGTRLQSQAVRAQILGCSEIRRFLFKVNLQPFNFEPLNLPKPSLPSYALTPLFIVVLLVSVLISLLNPFLQPGAGVKPVLSIPLRFQESGSQS